jgi:hypothetical protein
VITVYRSSESINRPSMSKRHARMRGRLFHRQLMSQFHTGDHPLIGSHCYVYVQDFSAVRVGC